MRPRSSRSSRDVGDGAHHFVGGVGIEEDGGAVHHLGQRRGIRANHRPSTGHGFQRRKSEALIKGREYEAIAGVIEMQQVGIRNEAGELNALFHAALPRRFLHLGGKPGGFPDEDQFVGQLGVSVGQARKGADQADVVLAGLNIPHREDERPADGIPFAHGGHGRFPRNRAECRRGRQRHHQHFVLFQAGIHFQNRVAGIFGAGEDPGGAPHSAPHGDSQLQRPFARKVFRVFQIADVVDGDHERHGTAHGGGVLDMQHVGTVFAEPVGEVEAQPQEGVCRHPAGTHARRNGGAGLHAGDVGQDVAILVLGGKGVQEASHVHLISREVPADGVGINGD